MCLEFFDEDESLRLLHCNVHRTREMIRGKLQRQKTEIPGNPMRAVEDKETFVVVAREGSFAAAAREARRLDLGCGGCDRAAGAAA